MNGPDDFRNKALFEPSYLGLEYSVQIVHTYE